MGCQPVSNTREHDSQPAPTPNNYEPTCLAVIRDIEVRMAHGLQKYGVALQPFNGRKSTQDAYEEALDLCIYLKNKLVEEEVIRNAECLMDDEQSYIAVDLDGTLALHEKWQGPHIIGEPISEMIEKVKEWLAEGKRVKLFTARFSVVEQRAEFLTAWIPWSQKHLGQVLEVTCTKEIHAVEFWDDKAVRVFLNQGKRCCQ